MPAVESTTEGRESAWEPVARKAVMATKRTLLDSILDYKRK